jgi:hypothetical protein
VSLQAFQPDNPDLSSEYEKRGPYWDWAWTAPLAVVPATAPTRYVDTVSVTMSADAGGKYLLAVSATGYREKRLIDGGQWERCASRTDQRTLHYNVIALGILTDSVPEAVYDEFWAADGSLGIPYSTTDGDLVAVYLVRSNTSASQVWGDDYDAAVNTVSGDVTCSFYSTGPYLVKTLRIGSDGIEHSTIFDIIVDSPYSGKGATGKTNTVTGPPGNSDVQLTLISSANGANDNGAMAAARCIVGEGNYTPFNSVADAITKINAKWEANGHKTICLNIIEHANVDVWGMGCGTHYTDGDGKSITLANASQADLLAFGAACNGKVEFIHHWGCHAGKDYHFLQVIADAGNCQTMGWNGSVYWVYRFFGVWNHVEASEDGSAHFVRPGEGN